MSSKIYVVSKFLGGREGINKFHFIGYYKGNRVSSIEVLGGDFLKGEDYILAITRVELLGETLQSILVKSKKIT